jgi:hypothetical protein
MRDVRHVVAFGGGTGLPVLLRGLRETTGDGVHAVVTVADDDGSSGRLRRELGVAPPGDVRRCLVALAERRELADVFEYRFDSGIELRDPAVGNLIIAALADMSGGFWRESSRRVDIATRGRSSCRSTAEQIESLGVRLHSARLLPDPIGEEARHDPHRLARTLLDVATQPKPASAYGS